MSSKTWLVAIREYTENLRTKTFWIGILFIPIIIILMIVVPKWLDRSKDVRKYAVVPQDHWLLEEAERRAAMPDLEKVLGSAFDKREKDPESFAELPERVRAMAELIVKIADMIDPDDREDTKEELEEEYRRRFDDLEDGLVVSMAKEISELAGPEGEKYRSIPGFEEEIDATIDEIRQWWQELPPDEASEFGQRLSKSRYQRIELPETGDDLIQELNDRVTNEEIFAYFVIGEDPEEGSEGCKYVSNNLTDDELSGWFGRLATDVVRERRLVDAEIDKAVADKIQERLIFEAKQLSAEGEEEEVSAQKKARQWAPVAFVYLLWLAVFSITQMLLTNTIEEKSNRILEVLLSSVSPLQLMAGKIGGIAMTGLTMVTSWVLCFVVLVNYLPGLVGMEIPLDFAAIIKDPVYLTSFLVYFFLGYLFFAAFLVGIGSVCNSVKEASNLMMPVTVVLMIPLMAMIPISQDPNGSLAKFLSYVPPFTPFVMMNRAAAPPTLTEYVVTTILLLVSIAVALWAAAKIFRIGILMTGKVPTPMEIFRWLKAPVGQVPTRDEE